MLDLTRIDLATDEDRQYQIDYWAALFKATTWEELRMLAEKNDAIAAATETVYKLSEEEMIRLQCEAREDYYRCQRDAQILTERAKQGKKEAEEREQEALQQAAALKRKNLELSNQVKQLTTEVEKLRARQAD